MHIVGLTGNVASGKSTVAAVFASLGATVIDADALARAAVERGTPGYAAIVRRWGNAVVAADGGIDRSALRRIVFSDQAQREELNAIVHPRVEQARADQLAAARKRGDRIVVCDIPLLFEKKLEGQFDRIVLVDAAAETRLRRLVEERQLPEAEARAMIEAQHPAGPKRARADHIIDNNGTLEATERRACEVWRALVRDALNPERR